MTLEDIGYQYYTDIFFATPYRTGNLAINGKGELYNPTENSIAFDLFFKGTEYGNILNDAQIIHYKAVLNGRTYTGSYVNKHYKWLDNFMDKEAAILGDQIGAVIL